MAAHDTQDSGLRLRGKIAPHSTVPRARRAVILVVQLAVAFGVLFELQPLLTFRPVDAVVVSASLEPHTIRNHSPSGRRSHSGFLVDVSYRYLVGGETYTGTRYLRWNWMVSGKAARHIRRTLIPGTKTLAWYNPFDPREAVLTRRPNGIWIGILLMVAVFAWLVSLVGNRRPGQHLPSARAA